MNRATNHHLILGPIDSSERSKTNFYYKEMCQEYFYSHTLNSTILLRRHKSISFLLSNIFSGRTYLFAASYIFLESTTFKMQRKMFSFSTIFAHTNRNRSKNALFFEQGQVISCHISFGLLLGLIE